MEAREEEDIQERHGIRRFAGDESQLDVHKVASNWNQ